MFFLPSQLVIQNGDITHAPWILFDNCVNKLMLRAKIALCLVACSVLFFFNHFTCFSFAFIDAVSIGVQKVPERFRYDLFFPSFLTCVDRFPFSQDFPSLWRLITISSSISGLVQSKTHTAFQFLFIMSECVTVHVSIVHSLFSYTATFHVPTTHRRVFTFCSPIKGLSCPNID